jgi:hypothetical protein
MKRKTFEMDLDVHKAIEARRATFDEDGNDILRRVFGLTKNSASLEMSPEPLQRNARRGGAYRLRMNGKSHECTSLKEVLRTAIVAIEAQQAGFIDKLASHRTTRGRRIVARKPEELYPGNPQLTHCADRLNDRWWLDTNVSFNQTKRYLGQMATISGIKDVELTK